MDWENERYVRVYTRPTVTIKQLRWEGRVFLRELFTHVDRCGILEMEGYDLASDEGLEALSALIDLPLEVVRVGLARALKLKSVQVIPIGLFVPKFMRAQEAKQSDPQRQRESRAKRHAEARAAGLGLLPAASEESRIVTDSHEMISGQRSQSVTNGPDVGIDLGQNVTPSRATLPQNRDEVVGTSTPDVRDSLLRFREKSCDALGVPRVSFGSTPTAPPSAALIELWKKALVRLGPVRQSELDAMAEAIGRGDVWGTERLLPASRLAQLPDQRRPDNFENLLIWVRSPDRPIPPLLVGDHPARYFGSARHRADQQRAQKRGQKRASATFGPPAGEDSPAPDPRQHAWDFLTAPKVPHAKTP